MLNADTAAAIASRHNLTLADAVSLRALCDDEAEAETIAAKFVDADEKSAARALFGTGERPDLADDDVGRIFDQGAP